MVLSKSPVAISVSRVISLAAHCAKRAGVSIAAGDDDVFGLDLDFTIKLFSMGKMGCFVI